MIVTSNEQIREVSAELIRKNKQEKIKGPIYKYFCKKKMELQE